MKLLLIDDHDAYSIHPDLEAKHAIVEVNDKFVLSMVWANSDRITEKGYIHGFYQNKGQVEIMLMKLLVPKEELSWTVPIEQWDAIPGVYPKGYCSEDDVEYWIERVRKFGVEGWEDDES